MNFVKKNLKWIITIIVVIILTTGISVYATEQYLASQVNYTTNKNGEVQTVADALNDLYSKTVNETEYNKLKEKYNNMKLLYKNTTGTSDGNAVSIDIDGADYNYFQVIILKEYNKGYIPYTILLKKGEQKGLSETSTPYKDGHHYSRYRTISVNSTGTKVDLTAAIQVCDAATSSPIANELIPMYIIGYKYDNYTDIFE